MIIVISGDNISLKLGDLIDQLDDLEKPFEEIGEMLLLSHTERHDKQESPDGTPWQELSPATKKRKEKLKKHPDEILIFNGYLRSSYTYQAAKDSLEFGTNILYAATHQYGDTERNIPARPFLGASESDLDDILDIFYDYFTE